MPEPAPSPSPNPAPPPTVEEEAKLLAPDIEFADPTESDDDDKPNDTLRQMALAEQRSAALKPATTAAQELYSLEADKVASRTKLQADYKAAYEAAPAGLKARHDRAEVKFKRAADDMSARFEDWLKKWLDSDEKGLRRIFKARRQVERRLGERSGPREALRDRTGTTAARWQKAFSDWSAPHAGIDKLLSDYEDKIDKLNADINTDTNADLAIYQFWFEVAPKHLQLRVGDPNADYPAIAKIEEKLKDFQEFQNFLKPGKERPDGSLYLINPDELPRRRQVIFTNLKRAAEEQAKRETDYKLRPDDGASLKKRREALSQSRAAEVTALLHKA